MRKSRVWANENGERAQASAETPPHIEQGDALQRQLNYNMGVTLPNEAKVARGTVRKWNTFISPPKTWNTS